MRRDSTVYWPRWMTSPGNSWGHPGRVVCSQKHSRSIFPSPSVFLSLFASDASRSTSKRNSMGSSTEPEEDVSSEDRADSWPIRLSSQPSCQRFQQFRRLLTHSGITGGTMRDYQLEALNWMISLLEAGVAGILADEVGFRLLQLF